jgi:hypothetical protein
MHRRELKVIIFLIVWLFTLFIFSACEVEFEPSITPINWSTVPPASEFEFESEIDPRASQVQEAIDVEDYQLAIEMTIELYDLDVSNAPGVPQYNEKLIYYGITDPRDGSIEIGPDAFSSPGMLATTIGHEAVHATQIAEGRSYLDVEAEWQIVDLQGYRLTELEAWKWELEHADENGLTNEELAQVQAMVDKLYDLLTEENQALADEGIYTLPTPGAETP